MKDESFMANIGALPRLKPEDMDRMRFVDVEASGLHATSYPIEVGWCGLDLKPVSMLIKPLPEWGPNDWSYQAEQVHGISRETLEREGMDAREVAEAIAAEFRGCEVFSDAPRFDAKWLMTLFSAVDVRPGFGMRPVEDAQALCARMAAKPFTSLQGLARVMEDVSRVYRHTHRAGDDCLRQAAQCRGLYDDEWYAALLDGKRGGKPPL